MRGHAIVVVVVVIMARPLLPPCTTQLLHPFLLQAAGSVIVTRTLQREFTPAHWGQLATKLRQWRDSVAALVSTMETGAAGGSGHRGGAAGAATA